MAKFEKVSKYASADFPMPTRKTKFSAGYDMAVAEDVVILPLKDRLLEVDEINWATYNLQEIAELTKMLCARPTLVSTGVKCHLDPGTYLELSVRSSTPLKHWIMMANGIGIIDADYYNNPQNEGEIFFQLINLTNVPIVLKKGDIIGQGIIKTYLTTEDDCACGERIGGLGSTSK